MAVAGARAGPVPDQAAHRLRHGHHPGPRAREGGRRVWTEGGRLAGRAVRAGAFTINTGDLLARWSGSRWSQPAPGPAAAGGAGRGPGLAGLLHEADHAVIEALKPPVIAL
jgi:hypothetical protein